MTGTSLTGSSAVSSSAGNDSILMQNKTKQANERAAARNLQRQKLDGNKINSAENYNNEHSEYDIVAPPADRAIFILRTIKPF